MAEQPLIPHPEQASLPLGVGLRRLDGGVGAPLQDHQTAEARLAHPAGGEVQYPGMELDQHFRRQIKAHDPARIELPALQILRQGQQQHQACRRIVELGALVVFLGVQREAATVAKARLNLHAAEYGFTDLLYRVRRFERIDRRYIGVALGRDLRAQKRIRKRIEEINGELKKVRAIE